MRVLLAVMMAASIATAARGTTAFYVDPQNQIVQTSRFLLQFDKLCPERVTRVVYFPLDGLNAVNGEASPGEFTGQMLQGLWQDPGPIRPDSTAAEGRSWSVLEQTEERLVIRIESRGLRFDQPPPAIRTDYTFWPDSSFYQVERTVFFGATPMPMCQWQPYLLRLRTSLVHTARWRDAQGYAWSEPFCDGGCAYFAWNLAWSSSVGSQLSVTVMSDPSNVGVAACVNDWDLYSHSGWTGPITDYRAWNTDVTWKLLVHFSLTPGNDELENRVFTWWAGRPPVGVGAAASPQLALAVAPNPVVSDARVSFVQPAAGSADVGVFDLAGRRVATLAEGLLGPGEHVVRWDGRTVEGRRATPGFYLVRVRAGSTSVVRRIALLQ